MEFGKKSSVDFGNKRPDPTLIAAYSQHYQKVLQQLQAAEAEYERALSQLRAVAYPPHRAGISPRELQVLERIVGRNLSNKEIAAELNVSERTVKFHVSNLLAKYRVSSRTDLILQATALTRN